MPDPVRPADTERLKEAKGHVERALREIVEIPDSLERDAILADLQGGLTKIVRLVRIKGQADG